MTTITIAIVEDEKIYHTSLKKLLLAYGQTYNLLIEISIFEMPKDFLSKPNANYDLIFMDIELGDVNGLSLARKIRKDGYRNDIIFLTNYKHFVFEGYDVNALAYLLKPINAKQLHKYMQIVLNKITARYYTYKINSETFRIKYSDILYFSSDNHYIDIITKGQPVRHYGKLKEISTDFPHYFLRCHRSIIVNMLYVTHMNKDTIYLDGTTVTLPISKTNHEALQNWLFDNILESIELEKS